ncbi:LytTR family DNA-binding domain-containing protein [Phyllobacterium sp. P30BS-XVII]|uniref:LytR/AlgR family response regulator transcription factor n=1 Tax=Phyllobacterium sp. P30BS-XVII TaxID=2587046 RepID=UPI000DDCFC8B|nr:LytTR family DNA-binding domain-containing protein [Phyllobacterium sp. P30BS-XVII]MBA8902928.1 DNA-binding LytR/AlgR family response regulator [Phyllobacterium sp. P30BS-XVII]
MKELSVLIVDDEPLARRRLMRMLETIQGFRKIGEAGDVRQAYECALELSPDIMLLDIQMPGGNGFDVLEQLGTDVPVVIFVTAFDHHALRAFDACAVDYVTKPIEPSRLHSALIRARLAVEARSSVEHVEELQETIAALRQALHRDEPRNTDLWIKHHGDSIRLPLEKINWIEAERDYVRIHTSDRHFLHHESLASMERRLDISEFIRIHRSAIVRRSCIAKLKQAPFSALIAVLADGSEIRVGRTYSKTVRVFTGA